MSVPSAEFQRGWYAAIRAAEAIALKWRDENREAAAKARKRDARATRLGFESVNLHEQLDGAAIECNAIAAAILALPCVEPPRAEPLLHVYRPHRKWPWFCADCGYPEDETLEHLANPLPPESPPHE